MKSNIQKNKNDTIGTLMIVDDEVALLDIYEHYFVRYYNVITVSSGIEALKLIQDGAKPQVIISDQFMPEMPGDIFLAETIKYLPDSIRIIITGNADNSDIYNVINRSHSYLFLTKPINEFQIIQAVRVCFNHYYLSNKNKVLQNKLKLKQFYSNDYNDSPDSLILNVKEFNKILGLSDEYYFINPQILMNNLLWKISLKLKNKSEDYKFLLQSLNIFCFTSIIFPKDLFNFIDNKLNENIIEKFNSIRSIIHDSLEGVRSKVNSLRFNDYFVNLNVINTSNNYSMIDESELELYLIFEFIIIYTMILYSKREDKIDLSQELTVENIKDFLKIRKEQIKGFITFKKDIYPEYMLEAINEIVDNAEYDFIEQINSSKNKI